MQFIQHLAATAAATLLLTSALPAQAHICMEAPVSRVGPSCTISSPQKPGPCGINTRSTSYVTEFKPGETITVTLNETVNHESHYRIAFNPNGATFEDPTGIDDKSGNHPFVLLDGITDESAARQSIRVTLPNMTCDNCTLQLIQVMYDKTGNGFGNDDIYYSCADIVLKGTPAAASDAGTAADAGSAARPLPDASAAPSQDPLPPLPADAGVKVDAAAPSGLGADASTTTTTGSTEAGTTALDASVTGGLELEEDDEDGGGCSIATQPKRSGLSSLAALAALAALLHRRRRRS